MHNISFWLMQIIFIFNACLSCLLCYRSFQIDIMSSPLILKHLLHLIKALKNPQIYFWIFLNLMCKTITNRNQNHMLYVSVHRIFHEKELEMIPCYHLNFIHTHETSNFTENRLNHLISSFLVLDV